MRGHSFRAVLASVILVGCSDEPSVRFDVGNDDTLFAGSEVTYGPEDQFATLSRDGVVKLGLTRERVYFTISDAVREHVDTEIEKGMEESDSRLGRAISGAVRSGVRAHHWRFGDMPPQPQVAPADVEEIIRYVRWVQRQRGIE